jgi:Na+-transporting NADH:ubiquinone oxidoreductase subunit NqrB
MDENTLLIAEYVDLMAMVLDLQLNPEYRTGVIENFAKIKAIASLVNEFPLPDNIEAAPIFEP